MFITVTNGRVVLKDSVWDKEKKCAKTVQIKSFGRRDAMSDEEYEALRAAYQAKSSRGIAKKMTEELIAKTSSNADQVKGGLHLRQYVFCDNDSPTANDSVSPTTNDRDVGRVSLGG